MSSFLQQNIPTPKPLFSYVNVSGTRGLANGEHFFVCLFGKVSEGEEYWQNKDITAPTAAVIKSYCQLWVHEKAAQSETNNGFARWLYTGKDDPVHVLGLDTKDQSLERLKEIYGDKAPRFPIKQPEVEYVLPVIKVVKKGKKYDLDSAEPMLLIIRENMLQDIIVAAKNFIDLEDPSIYGKVLVINKDLSQNDPKNKYNVTLPFLPEPLDISSFNDVEEQMRSKAIEDIEKVFKEANGGEYNANNVWNYLHDISGLSREKFTEKYQVKSNGNSISNDAEIEEVEI